jgi:ketosteroid isomerase-like protein
MSETQTALSPDDTIVAPLMRAFGDRDHPNALKMKHAHDLFKAQDLDAFFALYTDDIAWYLPGNNVLSGTWIGRAKVMENFAILFREVEQYWAYPLDYFGSDNHVVLVARVRAVRRGKTLDCEEVLLLRVADDGRFSHVWHLALDERQWDEFFAH